MHTSQRIKLTVRLRKVLASLSIYSHIMGVFMCMLCLFVCLFFCFTHLFVEFLMWVLAYQRSFRSAHSSVFFLLFLLKRLHQILGIFTLFTLSLAIILFLVQFSLLICAVLFLSCFLIKSPEKIEYT